jgi:hypothetical protein
VEDKLDAAVFGVDPRVEHGLDRIVGRQARLLRRCGSRDKPDHQEEAE